MRLAGGEEKLYWAMANVGCCAAAVCWMEWTEATSVERLLLLLVLPLPVLPPLIGSRPGIALDDWDDAADVVEADAEMVADAVLCRLAWCCCS